MALTTPPPGFRGTFRDDPLARAVYSEAAGIARILPRGVAVPSDADDVCTLVRWAAETHTPLVPRGSGSSMAGGAVGDGVIVDLSRLDTMGPVEAAQRRIRCGPGAIRDAVDRAARAVGLQFPVDPSSSAFCTIGGMASTNAAGAHTLRYGAMRGWVEALDCVFADGTRAELRRGAAPPALPILDRALDALAPVLAAERREPTRHAGDANVHVNPLIDVREPDWRARAEALLDEISTLTGHLGGTLTGEHGDGRLRAPLLSRVWTAEALERFAAVKHAFDPDAILNPGAKVALPGARPLDAVKYDPALPALPEPARAALARVERERAYASSRLALLDEAALDGRAGGA